MSVVDNRKQKCYSICGENHRCFILGVIIFLLKIGYLLFLIGLLWGRYYILLIF